MDAQELKTAETVVGILNEGAWRVPVIPKREHWQALAHLKLRARVAPHAPLSHGEQAFRSAMETLSSHAAFRREAETAVLEVERAFRTAEIEALENELASIRPSDWGLSDAEQRQAMRVGGLVPAGKPGVGEAIFDHARERAALELTTGTLALDGFLQDLRRLKELQARIEQAKAELANLSTSTEREEAQRKSRVKQAKAERAALRKREAATV